MSNSTYKLLINGFLIAIFVLGAFLRFYNLSSNPPGLNWDEASTGYNAYSILKTGKDEYGNFLPLSIRSFDDYKPPLYTYLSIPFIWIFGLNAFSVRFLSAFLGSLTILIVFLFTKELFTDIQIKSLKDSKSFLNRLIFQSISSGSAKDSIALFSAFFVAVSPWALQFSRASYEGTIGLFFLILGVLCLLKGIKKGLYVVVAVLPLVLSMYSYHSYRLIVPLFILIFVTLFFKELKKHFKALLLSGVVFGLLILPIFYSFIFSESVGSRLSMVSRFESLELLNSSIRRYEYDKTLDIPFGSLIHNRRIEYAKSFLEGYFDHFNLNFLFLSGDSSMHHHATDMGMLYVWELLFMLFGVIVSIIVINKRIGLLFILLIISPFASALTTGTPHAVRGMVMLVPLHIFTAIGVYVFLYSIYKYTRRILFWCLSSVVIVLFIGNFVYYLHQYYVHTPIEYGYFWQVSHKELFDYLKTIENNYDHIIVTYQYDQPYIFYLFYNAVDPAWYQTYWNNEGKNNYSRMKRKIGKYEFRNINYSSDKTISNSILVGTPDEIPDEILGIKRIVFPSGKDAFVIIKT